MNVVMINSDQHNPEFSGCYGGATRTPNIDRLAQKGVRFENAYCNYPLCAPSRASTFTGRYAHEIGAWDNSSAYDGTLPDWGHHLRDNGIHTALVGRLDFTAGGDYGFETVIEPVFRHGLDVTGLCRGDYLVRREKVGKKMWNVKTRIAGQTPEPDVATTDHAIDWLLHRRPSERPWVLTIGYYRPHPRWQPRRELFEYYRGVLKRLPDKYYQQFDQLNHVEQVQSFYTCGYTQGDERLPDVHAAYHATVEELDEQVGRVLDALDECGARENTVLIYSSDHGEMARAHGAWGKVSLYEDSIRVPLIISGPGVPQGLTIRTPVSLIDLYPTINDLLGLERGIFARGTSLMRVAADRDHAYDSAFVFAESHLYPRVSGSFAVRRGRWKLIEYVDHPPMLFDLEEDPQELNNLVSDTNSDAVKDKLLELRACLYSVCSAEAVDRRARFEQRQRMRELERSGRMEAELRKRGFALENDQLVFVGE